MEQITKAIYEKGQLRLLEPVNLTEGQHVTVSISDAENEQVKDVKAELETLRKQLQAEEYPGEQRDTFEYLKRALDEDRLSDRKLFP